MNLGPINNHKNFPCAFNSNYELLDVLGKGGMGYVYKALDKKLNREVALKVLDTSSDAESVKRFYFEAQAMKELDHQNIVHVFDFGKQANQLFIAMTYVKGTSLASVLQNRKELDFEAIELIGKQVARGLLYAHSKGVIHRDIKPSNIMITQDNRVYIMDFGISYIQEMEKERLTMTGMTMGTPEYMSPEQCHGDEITIQSDIYSLGVILFEMTCGRLPFTGNKPIEIAIKHVQEKPPVPETLRLNVPPELSHLILKCLKKNMNERYQDMQELLDALDFIFSKKDTGSQAITRQKKKISLAPKEKSFFSSASKISNEIKRKKLMILAFFMFPLLIALLITLMLTHKPASVLQQINDMHLRASFEEKNLEGDCPNGYPPENLLDDNFKNAWLFPPPLNIKNPILVIEFPEPTLITHLGMAIGYQKSIDDDFGDRFRVFNKPKTIILKTKEGIKQKILFENIKGMQYPTINAIETTELQLFLEDSYELESSKNFAISEIRLLGLKLK